MCPGPPACASPHPPHQGQQLVPPLSIFCIWLLPCVSTSTPSPSALIGPAQFLTVLSGHHPLTLLPTAATPLSSDLPCRSSVLSGPLHALFLLGMSFPAIFV